LQSQANQYNTEQANQAQQMNLANAQGISGANTDLANQRTQYNAAVPQTVYQDQMQKATGVANAYQNQGQMAQNAQNNQNAAYGNLLGTGAKLGAAYMTGGASAAAPAVAGATNKTTASDGYNAAHGGEVPNMCHGGTCYAEGGEVHDHNLCMMAGGGVPGDDSQMDPGVDSTENDTVPANLSPHEIVLPRSVAQAPDAPQQAAQFVQGIKGGQQPQDMAGLSPTVGSFQEALKILEANGLELRLTSGSN
jgi:hypothetical protein